MFQIFSPDSKLMQALSRLADLAVLNVLFLLSCAPLITVGAASTALYSVCLRLGTDREEGIVKPYFRAFRANFRQATGLWLLLALFAGGCLSSMRIFAGLEGPARYGYVLFAALLVLETLLYGYAFPLLSRFENSVLGTLKNAILLGAAYLPRTAVMAALNILPAAVLFLNVYAFLNLGLLWTLLYFSAAAYLNAQLLRKVFAPYLKEELP